MLGTTLTRTATDLGRLALAARRGAGAVPRGAVANAREAMGAVRAAVSERRELGALLDGAADQSGDLRVLSEQECWALLRSCEVGRLAYVAREGVPDIAPVSYAVSGRDLLVLSGPGPKLQAAERGDRVAFEVDDAGAGARTPVRSVVVAGRASRLTPREVARLDPAHLPQPHAAGPRHHLLRITPTRVTGRAVS
jgi:nitroimidazol reductase NimA-like FMN-containing flavoprotein (pyridoxamine 5'-phosphate oxidase superfamily)